MTPDTALLERILWSQVERPLHGRLPAFEAQSASARAIRGVLVATELAPEESALFARWQPEHEPSRKLFDRLLQARVNRAVQEGLRVEAERLGLAQLPPIQRSSSCATGKARR